MTFYGNFSAISMTELKDFDTLQEYINYWNKATVWPLLVTSENKNQVLIIVFYMNLENTLKIYYFVQYTLKSLKSSRQIKFL